MTDRIKIYVIQTDTAGCWYQRLKMPLEALEQLHGDEFEVCWHCEPKSGAGPAVVIGQRIMGVGNHADAGWMRLCEDPGILAVYEIDDDIIDLDPGNSVPYSIFTPNREGTIRNILAADTVITSTPNLALKIIDIAKTRRDSHWPYAVIAPNCVERVMPAREFTMGKAVGPVTVGWAGSMFHQQDFPPSLLEQLRAVAAAHPDVRWVSIGADYIRQAVPSAQFFGWGSIQAYHERLKFLDIGIAPIQRTPFNASKSWIKALDYMAHGVVPVVEDWGQYPELVDVDPMVGLAVDGDWHVGLSAAINGFRDGEFDHAAIAARANEFLIDNQVWRWADVFRRAREL